MSGINTKKKKRVWHLIKKKMSTNIILKILTGYIWDYRNGGNPNPNAVQNVPPHTQAGYIYSQVERSNKQKGEVRLSLWATFTEFVEQLAALTDWDSAASYKSKLQSLHGVMLGCSSRSTESISFSPNLAHPRDYKRQDKRCLGAQENQQVLQSKLLG